MGAELRSSPIPWLWFGLSMAWAAVIFVTDRPAWPLALWIAITVAPVTVLLAHATPRRSGKTNARNTTNEGESK